MVKCAKVERKKAEGVRRKLINAKLLDPSHIPLRDETHVYFPLLKITKKRASSLGITIVDAPSSKRESRFRSMEDALRDTLTKKEMESLVTSFDIVGDIAVIEIPPSLAKRENEIASAIMTVHRNIHVVLRKMGPMKGVYRTRKLKVIGGEKRTETTYGEHGCRMKVDLAKMYFSPRLSSERDRTANLVKEGEKVLVLFAGCGPFPLIIGKRHPAASVVGIELNPHAVRYMKENIILNNLRNVKGIEGDVREVVPKRFPNFADRILMPLPRGAEEFLDTAFIGAKKGCVVHFYCFAPEEDPFSNGIKKIKEMAKRKKRKVKILLKKIVRPFAPRIVQSVIDFKIC
jgi:tRNA (guanine37-N1)-methyltransferase